jgi:hypothetical protein
LQSGRALHGIQKIHIELFERFDLPQVRSTRRLWFNRLSCLPHTADSAVSEIARISDLKDIAKLQKKHHH